MPVASIAPKRYLKGNASGAFRSTWRIRWNGDALIAAVDQASIDGLRATLIQLRDTARELVPVSADGSHGNPPGTLRDDINYEEPHETAHRIYARWGNFTVRYSIFVNWGTSRQTAVLYLERAMDAVGQKLAPNIKRYLRANF